MRTFVIVLCVLPVLAGCVARESRKPPQADKGSEAGNVLHSSSPAGGVERYNSTQQKTPEPAIVPDESRQLIEKLLELDAPIPGLASMMSGLGFAPLGHTAGAGPMVLTNHDLTPNDAVSRLVQLGPTAIPALLAYLDDARPTRYRAGGGYIMWLVNRPGLGCPAKNKDEAAIIAVARETGKWDKEREKGAFGENSIREMDGHQPFPRVTVGDACFTILGQITNRYYLATSYQPTGGMAVCSPVHNPEIAVAVRKIWASDNLPAKLKANWLQELAEMQRGGGWYRDGAAMRLLFYFGEEFVPDVVRRIDAEDKEFPDLDALCRAISFSESLAIQDRLVRLFRETTEEFTMAACLPVVLRREPELIAALLDSLTSSKDVYARVPGVRESIKRGTLVEACMGTTDPAVRAALSRLMPNIKGDMEFVVCADAASELSRSWLMSQAANLLARPELKDLRGAAATVAAIFRTLPDESTAMVDKWLESKDLTRQTVLALALALREHPEWRRWLRPLLSNTAESGYGTRQAEYQVGPTSYSQPEAIRLCDLAGWAVAQHDRSIKFTMEGSNAELDKQLEQIAQALNK